MKKDTKERLIAIIVLIFVFMTGFVLGDKAGYDNGFNRGIEVNHGDKWDCAYSYLTGFLMCDRTPKYK